MAKNKAKGIENESAKDTPAPAPAPAQAQAPAPPPDPGITELFARLDREENQTRRLQGAVEELKAQLELKDSQLTQIPELQRRAEVSEKRAVDAEKIAAVQCQLASESYEGMTRFRDRAARVEADLNQNSAFLQQVGKEIGYEVKGTFSGDQFLARLRHIIAKANSATGIPHGTTIPGTTTPAI